MKGSGKGSGKGFMALQVPVSEVVFTPEQEEAVRQELANILHHSCFKSSDRCSKLLRYVVEFALSKQDHHLKERTIGHDVFGRSIAYETSSDPVVRNAASELRRRLAQYHHEAAQSGNVSIELVPGSYIPEFRFAAPQMAKAVATPVVASATDTKELRSSGVASPTIVFSKRHLFWGVCATLIALCIVTAGVLFSRRATANASANDRLKDPFWMPILMSSTDTLISVADDKPPAQVLPSDTKSSLPFVDAKTYTSIAGLFTQSGKGFDVRPASETDFAALRDRPVILLGGFRNPWMKRLGANARYRVDRDDNQVWVEDSAHAGLRVWQTDWRRGIDHSSNETYSMISRVKDSTTGGIVVTVYGLGTLGAEAASEFLSKRVYTEQLPKQLSDPNVNIQIVLKSPVVDGTTGAPTVIATYLW
jgi:hypothetical protein